jgi:hypothetical protein
MLYNLPKNLFKKIYEFFKIDNSIIHENISKCSTHNNLVYSEMINEKYSEYYKEENIKEYYKENKDEEFCGICLNTLNENFDIFMGKHYIKFDCEHKLHYKCFYEYLSNEKNTCPMCRKNISFIKYPEEYNIFYFYFKMLKKRDDIKVYKLYNYNINNE